MPLAGSAHLAARARDLDDNYYYYCYYYYYYYSYSYYYYYYLAGSAHLAARARDLGAELVHDLVRVRVGVRVRVRPRCWKPASVRSSGSGVRPEPAQCRRTLASLCGSTYERDGSETGLSTCMQGVASISVSYTHLTLPTSTTV